MGYLYGNADVDSNNGALVSAWPLNNNLIDYRGSNNGTNFGTTDVAGKHDRGRRFVAASTQHIDFGDGANLAPTTGFTLAGWVNWTGNVSSGQALMGKHDSNGKRSYLITGVGTNALRGIVSSDGSNLLASRSLMTTANNVIVPGTWQLVIFTFSTADKTIRIYVDNVDQSTAGDENAASINTEATVCFALGATHASTVPVNYLNADVSDCSFWRNQVLSANARTGLWKAGDGRFYHTAPSAYMV